jgi:hypothetical protein
MKEKVMPVVVHPSKTFGRKPAAYAQDDKGYPCPSVPGLCRMTSDPGRSHRRRGIAAAILLTKEISSKRKAPHEEEQLIEP